MKSPSGIARLAFAFVFLMATQAFAQTPQRIATIDLVRVFESYYKTKQADAVLENSGGEVQKVYTGLLEDLKKANDEYKKLVEGANDQAVSSDERERRKKMAEAKLLDIRDLENSVAKYRKNAMAQLQEQKVRLRDKILAELREVVDAKAKAGNYTMVLDVSAKGLTDTQVVIFSNGQNDLTEEVISHVNATAPQGFFEGTKPAPAEGPVTLPKVDEKGITTPGTPAKKR